MVVGSAVPTPHVDISLGTFVRPDGVGTAEFRTAHQTRFRGRLCPSYELIVGWAKAAEVPCCWHGRRFRRAHAACRHFARHFCSTRRRGHGGISDGASNAFSGPPLPILRADSRVGKGGRGAMLLAWSSVPPCPRRMSTFRSALLFDPTAWARRNFGRHIKRVF